MVSIPGNCSGVVLNLHITLGLGHEHCCRLVVFVEWNNIKLEQQGSIRLVHTCTRTKKARAYNAWARAGHALLLNPYELLYILYVLLFLRHVINNYHWQTSNWSYLWSKTKFKRLIYIYICILYRLTIMSFDPFFISVTNLFGIYKCYEYSV